MKKTFIILCALTLSYSSFAQYITFDDSTNSSNVEIDTINNTNNIWEIGQPQKNIFDSAYSAPYAILTDSINNYPKNDSSSFYVWHTSHHFETWWPTLKFHFKIDSDTLNDFGIIEVSPDNGLSWINVITEGQNYGFDWYISSYQNNWTAADSLPFTGTTINWSTFDLTMFGWDQTLGYTDSILFRFSFFSDSIETNQDGWVIDNINMGEYITSVNEISETIKSEVYPNPATENLIIKFENVNSINFDLTITNAKGQIVSQSQNNNQSEIKLDISNFNAGIYFYQLTNENSEKQARGTFVKE